MSYANSSYESAPRRGSFIAVVLLHVLFIYAISTSLGIVEAPKMVQPMVSVFIDEPQKVEAPPAPPQPEVAEPQPVMLETPPPMVEVETAFEEAPPAETAPLAVAPASATPINALSIRSKVEPQYPAASRRAGEEGTVTLNILIGQDGRTREVVIAKSSGYSRLDQAAIEAVRKWRFNANASTGNWVSLPITFRLEQAG